MSIGDGGSLNYFHGAPALLRTLAGFSLGVLLYRAHTEDLRLSCNWAAIVAVLFTGMAAITRMDFLIVGAFGCLIYYVVKTTDIFGRLLNSGPCIALGNWSYSIYLWHAPTHFVVMVALAATGHPVNDLSLSSARLLLWATALVVVGLAAVHYQYVEAPVRRMFLRVASNSYIGRIRAAN